MSQARLETQKAPVYFLSIGGPNFIENTGHPAYARLAPVGREITTTVKPKAIVLLSAYWQEHKDKIAINTAEPPALIYDFYGFPKHYYEIQFPYRGSPEVADRVAETLKSAGIEVERVKRGLGHGVWVGFLAAFSPNENPLGVPIVQVSLYDSDDTEQRYRLGQALRSLREQGILIIGAGMAVHNLPDFRTLRAKGEVGPMPYASTFDAALKEVVVHADSTHPTLDHVLPIYVAAGAAGEVQGEQLWTMPEGSLKWAQYRFG